MTFHDYCALHRLDLKLGYQHNCMVAVNLGRETESFLKYAKKCYERYRGTSHGRRR